MSLVKKILQSEEKVIAEFTDLRYQGDGYNGTITNLRTVFVKQEKESFIEIDQKSLIDIALEKEWYVDLKYLISISFCLAFVFLFAGVITYFPLSFTPANIDFLKACLIPGLIFLGLGLGAAVVYFMRTKASAILTTFKENFQIFSYLDTVIEFISILKDVKAGKVELKEPKGSLFFSKYPLFISKILMGASAVLFCMIYAFSSFESIRDLFYIPFLLLLIGFISGVLGYRASEVKSRQFKWGILLMFIGMNTLLVLFHFEAFAFPALIPLVLGAGLYFDC